MITFYLCLAWRLLVKWFSMKKCILPPAPPKRVRARLVEDCKKDSKRDRRLRRKQKRRKQKGGRSR